MMRDLDQLPHVSEEGHLGPPDEEGGPNPCPWYDEVFNSPDAESMEEAIGKCMEGLQGQEHTGFTQLHRLLRHVPGLGQCRRIPAE